MEKLDKLIELLNEYVKELGIGGYVGWHNEKTVRNSEYIITKKFGFIKWLVDNDKIDFDEALTSDTIIARINYWENEAQVYDEYDKYESLLMLLAISDTTIDDLISYLK